MDVILHNPAHLWLAFGAVCIVFEALTMPGIGLFLAGLGALGTGILIKAGVADEGNTLIQFAWFFGLTTLATLLLWKPLKKWRTSQNHGGSIQLNTMIGATATVAGSGLVKGATGQVAWSGTLMRAELAPSSTVASLPADALVEIVAVSGTTLHVIPK